MTRATRACALLLLLVGSAAALPRALKQRPPDNKLIPGMGFCSEWCKAHHPDELAACKEACKSWSTPQYGLWIYNSGMCGWSVCLQTMKHSPTCEETECPTACVLMWKYLGKASLEACHEYASKWSWGQTKP